MVELKEEKIYKKLPLIYHYLMRSVSYEKWALYIYRLIGDRVDKNKLVLELGAGNCKFAGYFSYYFPNIIVSDISFDMLHSGGSKNLLKVCCDMSSFPFKNKFDLVYSTFDSVNYLTSRKSLVSLFREVSDHLTDNGIFTFDVSLEKNSIIHSKLPLRKGIYRGIHFKQKSEYDYEKRIHKNIFKIKTKNGKVFTEIHKQRIYPFEDYFELLELCGLYVVECYDAFSFQVGGPESERVQFIVRKRTRHAGI